VRRSPLEFVLTAMVTALRASSGLTALIGSSTAVYNNVEQGAVYPYVVVSSPTDRRMDTFGRFGAETLVDVKAVSQYPGDREASRIIDQAKRTLDLQPLATTEHTTLGVAWDTGERFSEIVNGIVTRHAVGTFRVWTEQSSS